MNKDEVGIATEEETKEWEALITFPIKNARSCGICQSPADRHENRFQCQANPNHVGDLNVGIFSDLTYPTV